MFIPRRVTNSRATTALGGRLFPGVHQRARFTVKESHDTLDVHLEQPDGTGRVDVTATVADALPPSKLFSDLQAAFDFFAAGDCGYSPGAKPARFDGMRLRARSWQVSPLAVTALASSFYDDRDAFPQDSIEFDCALVM